MGYALTLIAVFSNSLVSGVSTHLVFSVAGVFFLGLPTVFKISSYALALSQKNGTDPAVAFFFALAASAAVASVFAFVALRTDTEGLAAVSIGSILATEAVLQSWDAFTGGVLGISGIMRPQDIRTLPRLAMVFAAVSLGILVTEAVLLKTPFGRALRAYRESPVTLDSMGISSARLLSLVIVIGSVTVSVSASTFIWRIQFVDPSVAGIPFLIELLTVSVLAIRPKIRSLALATLFVTLLPEALRFLHLPSSSFAQLRILAYSSLLLLLLHIFADRLHFPKRSV